MFVFWSLGVGIAFLHCKCDDGESLKTVHAILMDYEELCDFPGVMTGTLMETPTESLFGLVRLNALTGLEILNCLRRKQLKKWSDSCKACRRKTPAGSDGTQVEPSLWGANSGKQKNCFPKSLNQVNIMQRHYCTDSWAICTVRCLNISCNIWNSLGYQVKERIRFLVKLEK